MELKKNEDKRVERKMPLYYLVGLNVAIFLSIAAFSWKSEQPKITIPEDADSIFDEMEDIPITMITPPPPPPKPIVPVLKEVKEEPIETPEIIIDQNEVDEPIPEIEFITTEIIDVADEAPFVIVEEMPSFPGGMEGFYKFISKKVKYPAQARRMGIEGRVYVEFVVERDGSLGEIKVVKGIGAGLDEESLRVMSKVPSFNPGKQRGVPVRVKMTIPINFRLSN